MRARTFGLIFAFAACLCGPVAAATQTGDPAPLVSASAAGGFPLVVDGRAATIVSDPADHPVVAHAAADLAADILAVTGVAPTRTATARPAGKTLVVIGTLEKNRLIGRMAASGKLDVRRLRGAWESFLIATVEHPVPGIDRALVIVGSDRRGAAFGAYELSQAMGVSPWTWWADVKPRHRDTLLVASGTRRFGPPSVRYRGIFINDEDWGLTPWAAQTFDPAWGNIGPKTYAEVFRLLLRLKANTLWPAMHKTSAPFNSAPENARLADEYAIVMGSSHGEPMLRNNVGEWKQDPAAFNYAANPDGVRAYWEARVRGNARYESLWTLGMRGIHDSGIVGAETAADKVALLDRIIADQRALLRAHVDPSLARAPQVFTPYKEVLDLYRGGLKLPEDVTIVWPDDNFGYIRQFPNEAERARPGGAGVYYHLSYLGAPLSYLWLSTTPPALIQEEMTRAHDLGARKLWIANVGDIKPAEINISLFMEMAWDIDRWRGRSQRTYLDDWAGRTFGPEHGAGVGAVLDDYYRLNFERRPEHLQWWLPGEKPRPSPLSPDEVDARLGRFDALVAATGKVGAAIPADLSDAFFELVDYPVRASAAANRRVFGAERYAARIDRDPASAREAARMAVAADDEIEALTARFNNEIAGGKWRRIMAQEPADNQWAGFRISRLSLPAAGLQGPLGVASPLLPPASGAVVVEAEDFTANDGWRLVEGLGRGAGAMLARADGARITHRITVPTGESRRLELGLIPLYPAGGDGALHLEVSIDGAPPTSLAVPRQTGGRAWAQGVLDNSLPLVVSEALAPGVHDVTITARDADLAIDQFRLQPVAAPRAH
jgi:hypothetical protein